MDNCIIRINESIDTLSKQEQKIAHYVLDHQKEVSQMTVSELSKKSKSSTATIVRFCTALGYSGYRDFIKSFYHDVANNVLEDENIYEIDNNFDKDMSIKSMIYTVCKLNIEAINNTLKILDEKAIEDAVNAIDKANKVYLYALSGSKVVADDAVFKFQRLGIDCQEYDNSHSQILSASISKPNQVAIIISYTGETRDLLNTISYLKKTGCKTIGITKFGENPISKEVDISIQHSSIGRGLRTYSTRSRIVQHNIIDILFVALCQKRNSNLKKYYELFKDGYGTEEKIK
jgi:DNA-binding MurR/RpiR family transcriptional regulator